MKKTLRTLAIATASMITTGAMAGVSANMENPLFIPKAGQITSKTAAGLMYKKADHTEALQKKGHAGDPEFPVWRFFEDLGYGITDRTSAYVSLGWTQNDDINRSGAHRARVGAKYRAIETPDNFVWDIFGEVYMAGLSPMKGSYNADGFKYDNFSSGRWGGVIGTKLGKKWSKLTTALTAEYLQIFGNHNNKIKVNQITLPNGMVMNGSTLGFPDEISVDLKSTNEWLVAADAFYQLNDRWSFGGGLKFVEHSDNGVKSIHTNVSNVNPAVLQGLLNATRDMQDGWEEYYLTAVLANQISDSVQLALYGEYVFDTSHPGSQNGTDVKAEIGVRANVKF